MSIFWGWNKPVILIAWNFLNRSISASIFGQFFKLFQQRYIWRQDRLPVLQRPAGKWSWISLKDLDRFQVQQWNKLRSYVCSWSNTAWPWSIKYERCNLIFAHHYYAYESILFYLHNVHRPKAWMNHVPCNFLMILNFDEPHEAASYKIGCKNKETVTWSK